MDSTSVGPKVSLVVPVYNMGEELLNTIDSLTSQDYPNFEVILVDDGSSDETPDLCDGAAARDSRILVVHKPNGGVSSARNAGLAHVRGDYVMFVDADDCLSPGALNAAINQITAANADLACFGVSIVYHVGHREVAREVRSAGEGRVLDSTAALRENFFELFDLGYWVSAYAKLFSAQLLRKHTVRFNADMAILEDFEFVLNVLAFLPDVVVMPEALYEYRIDMTQSALSRRPDIDYLRNFSILETTLHRFGAAVGLVDAVALGRFHALAFKFYLIGVEMIFARPMGILRRYQRCEAYLKDERVVGAAAGAVTGQQRLAAMAWLVRHGCLSAVFIIYLLRGWLHRLRHFRRHLAVQRRRTRDACSRRGFRLRGIQ